MQTNIVYKADCLNVLKWLPDQSIDLIYLDPPFNTGKIRTDKNGEYDDKWNAEHVTSKDWIWHYENAVNNRPVYQAVENSEKTHSNSMRIYMLMMAQRLIEMHRVLKWTGSIYLHCDQQANSYLRILMDSIFGAKMFQNEIIWRRSNAHNSRTKGFGTIHDTILFYFRSTESVFYPHKTPYIRGYIKERFKHRDERGMFATNYLTGPGITKSGESGGTWKGFNPSTLNRHWAIPRSLTHFLPNKDLTLTEKLDALDKQGLIVFPKKQGGQPMYKQYIGNGTPYQDIWAYQPYSNGMLMHSEDAIDKDVKWLDGNKERVGYPTQKPEGLLKRIIQSSSQKDDIILDPFCGSGTTLVTALKLNRKYIGIDASRKAVTITKERLAESKLQGELI